MADLEAIQARADAATPGPWHGEHDEFGCVHIGDYGWVCATPNAPEYDVDSVQGHADAEFIAHARTDIPALLEEVVALQAERDVLRDKVAGQDEAIERVRRLVAYCRRDPAPHPDHDHLCPDDVLEMLNGQPAEKEKK